MNHSEDLLFRCLSLPFGLAVLAIAIAGVWPNENAVGEDNQANFIPLRNPRVRANFSVVIGP